MVHVHGHGTASRKENRRAESITINFGTVNIAEAAPRPRAGFSFALSSFPHCPRAIGPTAIGEVKRKYGEGGRL